jgi:nucleotide-binding universal stress UspA family protein
MFSHILVATDGSDHARKAVAAAADLARHYGARVTVVTVFEPIPLDLGTPYAEHLMARRLATAEELLREAAAALERAGVAHETDTLSGPPARTILDVAMSRKPDLIVLGSRGLGPVGQILLGSVSFRVVQEATCPVLLTR